MDSRVLAELIVHLGRITSGDGLVADLTPAQWSVLRYVARANRFSRTPSAFAAFHGTTRGTASQAIRSLVALGYITQARSETDGRSVRLDLTDKARAVLSDDPLDALVRAADALPAGVRGQAAGVLQRMLGHVSSETGKPLFGTCTTCRHFDGDACCGAGQLRPACRLVDEPLSEGELVELCINFAPGKSGRTRTAGTAPS